MPDLRMVGASVAALVVISSVFVGSASGAGGGITEFLSNIMEQIRGWFESSPFGGILGPTPRAKTVHAEIFIYPDILTLTPANPLNITIKNVTLQNFEGDIKTDFTKGEILMEIKDSEVKVSTPVGNLVLYNLQISSLTVPNTRFTITPNITAENGTLDIGGFSGLAFIGRNHTRLDGNFTSLKARIGELTWDLTA